MSPSAFYAALAYVAASFSSFSIVQGSLAMPITEVEFEHIKKMLDLAKFTFVIETDEYREP